MFDKVMFGKICGISCTLKELKGFASKMPKMEFDVEDCFEKYYSLDTILRAIMLCKDGKISADYFAYWCCAYNWIIMGGFQSKINDANEKNISLETMLIWEISDALDSLAFYNTAPECYDLDWYINDFCILDTLYRHGEEWTVYYSFSKEKDAFDDPLNAIDLLLISEGEKAYYMLFSDGCDFHTCILEQRLTKVPDIQAIIDDLDSKGYKNLVQDSLPCSID